jgi:hypothetical protein
MQQLLCVSGICQLIVAISVASTGINESLKSIGRKRLLQWRKWLSQSINQ